MAILWSVKEKTSLVVVESLNVYNLRSFVI